jgi:hypothetical protein
MPANEIYSLASAGTTPHGAPKLTMVYLSPFGRQKLGQDSIVLQSWDHIHCNEDSLPCNSIMVGIVDGGGPARGYCQP